MKDNARKRVGRSPGKQENRKTWKSKYKTKVNKNKFEYELEAFVWRRKNYLKCLESWAKKDDEVWRSKLNLKVSFIAKHKAHDPCYEGKASQVKLLYSDTENEKAAFDLNINNLKCNKR